MYLVYCKNGELLRKDKKCSKNINAHRNVVFYLLYRMWNLLLTAADILCLRCDDFGSAALGD